jgi:hypothetical protein
MKLLRDADPQKTKSVNAAMLGMMRIDIPGLLKACSQSCKVINITPHDISQSFPGEYLGQR